VRRVSFITLATQVIYALANFFLPHLVEFATVGQTKDGKIYHHLWGADEINALLRQHGLAKEEDTET
jgi:hypothetical protein